MIQPRPTTARGRVLVVEDEAIIRDALGPLLQEEGYEVSFSENGRDALDRLYTDSLPSIIVLDLRMPVMDGWQFRTIQKDDPKLGPIPVVVISADGSAQAAAISAEAYLRKPLDPQDLLTTVERVLFENRQRTSARPEELERLEALGRLASVWPEISNPLTLVTLNLSYALEELRPAIAALGTPLGATLSEFELAEIRTRLRGVVEMLLESQTGTGRIRVALPNLQRVSNQEDS